MTDTNRRAFLKNIAAYGGAFALASGAAKAAAPEWKKQIGLELYTVRDAMQKDYEGVLAKIASYGYKEIEPASGYNNLSAKDFRAMIDRFEVGRRATLRRGGDRHRNDRGCLFGDRLGGLGRIVFGLGVE